MTMAAMVAPVDDDRLPDDHIETQVLRKYAPGARCLVLAAYKGVTMRYLLDNGAQFVHGVEPQEWAYQRAVQRLRVGEYDPRSYKLEHCALVPWDVSERYGTTHVHVSRHGTDGAVCLPAPAPDTVAEPAENISRWIARLDPPVFDLAVVNCEGCEYTLLPYLDIIVSYLLVQFHGPGAVPVPVEQLYGYTSREEIGKGWWLYT